MYSVTFFYPDYIAFGKNAFNVCLVKGLSTKLDIVALVVTLQNPPIYQPPNCIALT